MHTSLTAVQWAGTVLLGGWFLLTLLFQFAPRHPFRYNPLGICFLPVWRLFAPEPVKGDFHLLYRGWREDDGFREWQEIPVLVDHTMRRTFFHPERYSEKTLLTLIVVLIGEYLDSFDVANSNAYKALLHYIRANSTQADAEGFQFAIVQSFGFHPAREPMLVFASSLATFGDA